MVYVTASDNDHWLKSIVIATAFNINHDTLLVDIQDAVREARLLKLNTLFKVKHATFHYPDKPAIAGFIINRALFNFLILACDTKAARQYRMQYLATHDQITSLITNNTTTNELL